jgi:hypothetical protein
MWKDTEISYLAGIIDGEGSIYIQQRAIKPSGYISYFPRFQIVNTDRQLMEWIHNKFGGLIYDKPRIKHNPKWRMQIEWFTTRSLMDKLLPLIIPYLIIKKPHAMIMQDFRKSFQIRYGKGKIPKEIYQFRLDCLLKIKQLNHPI